MVDRHIRDKIHKPKVHTNYPRREIHTERIFSPTISNKRTGLVPKTRVYRCLKCNKMIISRNKITSFMCPYCLSTVSIHKKCGGRVIEYGWKR